MFELTWVSRVSCFSDFCYRPASDLGLGMYDLSDAKAASDQFKYSPHIGPSCFGQTSTINKGQVCNIEEYRQ